jgi:PAS domain S-box-containing protein
MGRRRSDTSEQDEIERLRARVAELEQAQADGTEAEVSLRATRDRLAGILSISEDAIISIDERQRILMFNRGAEKIFGYLPHEILGCSLDLLLPQGVRAAHRSHVDCFGTSSDNARWMGERQEIAGLRKDGSEFPAEASISKFVQQDGKRIYTVILRDVTERNQREQQLRRSRGELRRLAARMESIREDESRRIAREVHDELGQSLTVLKLRLLGLAKRLHSDPYAEQQLQELAELVTTTMQTVRRIATELRPVLLDTLGLEPALERHLQEFERATDIQVDLQLNGVTARLNPASSIALFRIVQEALTNIARHAAATRVKVFLDEVPGMKPAARLEISDNGKGFDPREAAPRALGLLGMKERALHVGGEVTIESEPGKGTKVVASIPFST